MARKRYRKRSRGLVEEIMTAKPLGLFIYATIALATTLYANRYAENDLIKILARTFGQYLYWFALFLYCLCLIKLIYSSLKGSSEGSSEILIDNPKGYGRSKIEPAFVEPDNKYLAKKEQLEWSIDLINEIEWRTFEKLIEKLYVEKGHQCECTNFGADGGIDIVVYKPGSKEPESIIQCKAWSQKVGVKEIREFLGVMTHVQVNHGIYVTTTGYTDDAIALASQHQIELFDAPRVIMQIKALEESTQERLLQFIIQDDFRTPTCPKCNLKMSIRRSGSETFWGCGNYPKCKRTFKSKMSLAKTLIEKINMSY